MSSSITNTTQPSAPRTLTPARAIPSKTGRASVGEVPMSLRISAVAVCCSSVSVSSRFRASSSVNSRTFSIAITAWSANVLNRAIC